MGSVVLASGGAVADSAINPYIETPTRFEISKNMGDEGIQNINFAKNKPEMTLGKWNDEVHIKISRKGTFSEGNRALFSDKVKYGNAKEEVHIYPLDATAEMDEGGFEYEVILKEKPNTNVISMDIETRGLDFFYQPALTQKEIDEGAFRPENVVGSYAVFHKTKKNHRVGETNYKTGKAFHIYRPKIKDANGNEIWGELDIKGNTLTITIDQNWLDKAVYPVICDPTFGFTSIGATTGIFCAGNESSVAMYNLFENGDISKLTIYSLQTYLDTDSTVKAIIYTDNSTTPNTLEGTGVETVLDGAISSWKDMLFSSTISLTAGNWWIGAIRSNITSYVLDISLDTVNGNGVIGNPDTYSDGAESPWSGGTSNSYKYSIYATYTASGGAASPPPSNIFILD